MSRAITQPVLGRLLPIVIVVALTSTLSAREQSAKDRAPGFDDEYYELFEVFVDSLDQIQRNYVQEIDRRELIEAAIDGMVKKLDSHSSFIKPEQVDRFRSSVENKFGGIGIHVAMEEEKLTVISPLVGAPAYEAGVLAGDHIVEIEGESTEGITLDEAVRKLKGDVGTDVTITVQNGPKGERRGITITRQIVRVETVLGHQRNTDDSWDFMRDPQNKIAYIRVNSFSRDTARDLRKVLDTLKKQNVRGLVIDLRFNPGGLLTSAIEVCDMFVSRGKIVSTKGRNTEERVWQAKQKGTFEGFPMAILINRYSASASEIVSACLQDHDRATIVGERSYGKGSVQNVIELEDGKSVLKLTTASYRRPNGKNIHRFAEAKDSDEWGVLPDTDYALRLDDEELRRLVRFRRAQDIARGKKEVGDQLSDNDGDASDGDADDGDADDGDTDNGDADDGDADAGDASDGDTDNGDTDNGDADNGDTDSSEADDEDDGDVDNPATSDDNSDTGDTGDEESGTDSSEDLDEESFVDRQLERALDFLSSEIARAG